MSDGTVACRRFAEAFVATVPSLREFTRENMAPYFHDDVTWQSGVMRIEGIDIFIAANNQAWQTLGYPAVRDVEIDAGEDFAVVGYTLAGTHELPMMGQAATGVRTEAHSERDTQRGTQREALRVRDTQRGTQREALGERQSERGTRREALGERHSKRGTQRERHSERGTPREALQERRSERGTRRGGSLRETL
jgi:hypothetical protein